MARLGLILLLAVGSLAQRAEAQIHDFAPAIAYWEGQSASVVRDTTLIGLYGKAAQSTPGLDSAVYWLERAGERARKLNSSTWLAFVNNQFGAAYLRGGVTFQAIEYFYRALKYGEMAQAAGQQAISWSLLGDCYASLDMHLKAIDSEREAARLYELTRNVPGRLDALNDLGAALQQAGRLDESVEVLERGLAVSRSLQLPAQRITAFTHLAGTLLRQGDVPLARTHALRALDVQTETQGRPDAGLLALLALIEARDGNARQATDYAARAEVYLPYPSRSLAREKATRTLYLTYQALNDPAGALLWYKRYVVLRDQNRKVAQDKRVEVLRYEYDAQLRERQLKDLTEDQTRQRYLRNGLILIILVILLLVAALWRSNRLLKQRSAELDHSNEKLTQMGEALRRTNATLEERVAERTEELRRANQTLTRKNHEIQEALFRGKSIERKRVASELHDNLGSLLSGVKWKLETIGLEQLSPAERVHYQSVVKLIADAYDRVRHISHNLLPSVLETEGLIPALEKMIADLNRSNRVSFELICSDDLEIPDKRVSFELYSCLLELVNNILKHAHARQVVLEIVQTKRFTALMVTDDGVGISPHHKIGSGKGLENIRHRLRSLNGSFVIRPLGNGKGTTVTLRVPRQETLV